MLSLHDMLEAAASLEKRAARESVATTRDALLERKALVDVAAFGLFKRSDWAEALRSAAPALGKGLGWGVGLGVPALAVGHGLLRDARNQAQDVVHDARNQALLTALGVGGMQAAGKGIGALLAPNTFEAESSGNYGGDPFSAFQRAKLSADEDASRRLAEFVLLDDFLEARVNATCDKTAAECLVRNRELGAALLREVLR